MTTRKKYTKEFKLDAVSLVTDQGYSRAEAARSLGINANMLCRWVKEEQSGEGYAFRGNGKLTPEQEENRRLKAEIKRLKMEKERSGPQFLDRWLRSYFPLSSSRPRQSDGFIVDLIGRCLQGLMWRSLDPI